MAKNRPFFLQSGVIPELLADNSAQTLYSIVLRAAMQWRWGEHAKGRRWRSAAYLYLGRVAPGPSLSKTP